MMMMTMINQLQVTYHTDLRGSLPERVIVGFSAAIGGLYEVHTL